jgi:hypothetical protein
MKARNALVMPIVAIFVGLAMIVSAGMIVSNVIEKQNHVLPTTVIWLEMRNTTLPTPIGPDLLNYSDGDQYMSVPMDFNLYVKANATVSVVSVFVEFDKTTINATDVTMAWADGDGPWHNVVWTVGTGSMAGNLWSVLGYSSGNDANYYVKLTYNVPGDFSMKMWAEGTL